MQRFSYNYGEKNLEVQVDTIHGFHVTLNILSAPWDFRLKRKRRAEYKGPEQLPMLQWQLPEDCGVTIVMEPKPQPKPTWRVQKAGSPPDYRWSVQDVYVTTAVNPYSNEDFNLLRRYDSFLSDRKSWKQYKRDYVWNVVEELGGEVVD